MDVDGILSAEECQARKLVEQAGDVLRAGDGIGEGFVTRLFGQAAPEDLAGYSAMELAALARSSWALLAHRVPGKPEIRFTMPDTSSAAGALKDVSIIEIVNDDMPFLVDSVMAELAEQEIPVRLVAHPIVGVRRNASGDLISFSPDPGMDDGLARESLIHIHVDRMDDEARRAGIMQQIEHVLADVRIAVEDWQAMLGRVENIVADFRRNPPPLPPQETEEAAQFLEWLVANNFTFLGIRAYRFSPQTQTLEAEPETGLGILRDPSRGRSNLPMTADIRAIFDEPKALYITESTSRSRVHRRAFLDYVGVKRFDAAGNAVGEWRILGLFTTSAYTHSASTIPYIRSKVDALVARAGFNPAGHSGKALVNVIETYPRDELFQIDDETFHRFALAILQLEERPRVRVLIRRDRFDRFVSALVYLPRDRAGGRVIAAVGGFLAKLYRGEMKTVTPFFPEGPLVRVHFTIVRSDEPVEEPDLATLEGGVNAIIHTWIEGLSETLALSRDPAERKALFERYRRAFSPGYRDRYSPATAVEDIRTIEALSPQQPHDAQFWRRNGDPQNSVALKVWSYDRPIPLSERVPVLENMGFRVVDESTFDIAPGQGAGDVAPDAERVWMHDMTLERADGGAVDLSRMKEPLEDCFLATLRGAVESDGYNALVLMAGLQWREITLVRALSRYLRQVRVAFSQDYMWTTLRKHAAIAAKIVALFHARFDPALNISGEERAQQEEHLVRELEAALQNVDSLDEDRILRHFINIVRSGIRTNFYQPDEAGQFNPLIAIKFDSRKIDDLPLPRPLYEIFVYSPRVEGVHLRFGKVARGGIRWSDRPQDFRTEVLGLVKAQQVKNAVIVPVGAKGGFVPKQIPVGAAREVAQAEGVTTYRLFVSAMLGITDNITPDGILPPRDVVRHDGDDPYFVVAADKGTATFSDTANAISLEHDFWLGDAFASGGSAGYDHKGMGITARGGWEAVKRHFREMDVDIGSVPFTVAGIGDMSGDVFGNGMLRSNTIRLVAAFDHRDIFIDPDPDPARSFTERQRLYRLPRSSWQDYDKALISNGGGVFSRSAKEIALSQQMQALLGIEAAHATPQQVIHAILTMQVDLLWFGGIGTYIRASTETDDSVGDRANDAIRIAAAGLRCKVIGEGANLGMTQRGRIEAALSGVRLNTDAIDNSAGVNASDIEVNIKVALSPLLRSGELAIENRNELLTAMTDEVASLILRNNYLQTLALSLAQRRGLDDLGFQQRLMQTLEARNLLDRAVENLPDDKTLDERRRKGQPLVRPELAVLLAYAKLTLYSDLLDSKVPDDPYLGRELGRYFPSLLLERFSDAVAHHRLRREIIATHLANSIINRGGPSVITRMADETGASAETIAMAFAAVRDSYGMTDLNRQIDALDTKVSGQLQLDLYAAVQELLIDRLVWFIRNVSFAGGLADMVAHYGKGIAEVEAALVHALPQGAAAALAARADELANAGVPQALAQRVASLPILTSAPDVVLVADRIGQPVGDVAQTYFAARDYFRIDAIAEAARAVTTTDYFDRLALDRARSTLGEAARRLTADMMADGQVGRPALEAWTGARASEVERICGAVREIAGTGLTLSKLSVAASMLGDLAKT